MIQPRIGRAATYLGMIVLVLVVAPFPFPFAGRKIEDEDDDEKDSRRRIISTPSLNPFYPNGTK
jgi:hypothetical protein